MAGFPDTDIDEDWDEDEDSREYSRTERWEPQDDEVEAMIDFTDCDED